MAADPNRKMSQLHNECFENRAALTKIIQEFPALQGVAALGEITHAVQIGWNVPLDIASERAQVILQPGTLSSKAPGLHPP